MANNIPAWTLWIPLLSAILGGSVTGLTNFFINKTNKKTEERKHLKEMIIKTATENWKQSHDLAKFVVEKGEKAALAPIEIYIIHMAKLSEILLNPDKIDKNLLILKLKEIDEIIDAHKKYDDIKRKNLQ